MKSHVARCLATILIWSINAIGLAAETRFTIVDSSPTSWVARGYDNYTVTPAQGWSFTTSRNFDNGIDFRVEGPPLPGTNVDYWRMQFAAPFNATIMPGHYANFQRFPFQAANRPGLAFASTGHLDNRASGFFDVLEVTYGPGGQVTSFAANFTHYGEEISTRYAIVEFRYNSLIPEPTSSTLMALGILASIVCRRSRSSTRSGLTKRCS